MSHVVLDEDGGDRHTLAHELTHVIRQRAGQVAGTDHGNGLRSYINNRVRYYRSADQEALDLANGARRSSRSTKGQKSDDDMKIG